MNNITFPEAIAFSSIITLTCLALTYIIIKWIEWCVKKNKSGWIVFSPIVMGLWLILIFSLMYVN